MLDAFFELLRDGRWPAWVLLLVALAALVTAAVAALIGLAKSESPRSVGAAAMWMIALLLAGGALAVFYNRGAGLAAAEDNDQSRYNHAFAVHESYANALATSKLALELALLPMLLAAFAIARRKEREEPRKRAAVALGAASIGAIANVVLLALPLPPAPIPIDWRFDEVSEHLERGELGWCERLADVDRANLGFSFLAERCVEHWIAAANELEEPRQRKEALMRAWGSPLATDDEKRAITELVAKLVIEKSSPRIKRLFVSGGLSRPEVKRELLIHFPALRACYAALPSAATHPVDGTVTASFTIDDKGVTLKYSDIGSELPSKPVFDCLSNVLRTISYPPTGLGFAQVEVALELSDPVR